jgi:hypothetical protein
MGVEMIEIGYRLDPSWDRTLADVDLRTADPTALSYDLFLGDVFMRAGDADFSAPWRWVPVLDFAVNLKVLVEDLADGQQDRFQFTECEAEIRFARHGETVQISASYVPAVARVPYGIFLQAVRAFALRTQEELVSAYPALRENPWFQELQRRGRWSATNPAVPMRRE